MATDANAGRRTKVARLIDEYGFEALGAELERRWTAEGDERMSLRDLADYFNRRLLEAALADAGTRPLSGEVENVYRLLTDDDAAQRTRTRRQLEREAIDSDRIATLVEHLAEYAGYLLVALLPEDAAALPTEYERITEI